MKGGSFVIAGGFIQDYRVATDESKICGSELIFYLFEAI